MRIYTVEITQEISSKLSLRLPLVPNFLTCSTVKRTYSISEFSDNQLKAIGEAWTKRLLARAAEQRKSKL